MAVRAVRRAAASLPQTHRRQTLRLPRLRDAVRPVRPPHSTHETTPAHPVLILLRPVTSHPTASHARLCIDADPAFPIHLAENGKLMEMREARVGLRNCAFDAPIGRNSFEWDMFSHAWVRERFFGSGAKLPLLFSYLPPLLPLSLIHI